MSGKLSLTWSVFHLFSSLPKCRINKENNKMIILNDITVARGTFAVNE